MSVTLYYYGCNIHPAEEWNLRLEALKKLTAAYSVELATNSYAPDKWFDAVRGLENEPERGKRCYKCYKMRLEESAQKADELGFDYFCTTLTLSPHKNSNWINEIGEDLNNKYNSIYLYSDFKKKNGYKRSIELSKEYDLYRQDYCGCVYSLRDKMKE